MNMRIYITLFLFDLDIRSMFTQVIYIYTYSCEPTENAKASEMQEQLSDVKPIASPATQYQRQIQGQGHVYKQNILKENIILAKQTLERLQEEMKSVDKSIEQQTARREELLQQCDEDLLGQSTLTNIL